MLHFYSMHIKAALFSSVQSGAHMSLKKMKEFFICHESLKKLMGNIYGIHVARLPAVQTAHKVPIYFLNYHFLKYAFSSSC